MKCRCFWYGISSITTYIQAQAQAQRIYSNPKVINPFILRFTYELTNEKGFLIFIMISSFQIACTARTFLVFGTLHAQHLIIRHMFAHDAVFERTRLMKF